MLAAAILSALLNTPATFCRCAIADVSDVWQVKGKVLAENFAPLPPEADAPVDVFLHLSTHFGQQRVFLQKMQPEQDAQGKQGLHLVALKISCSVQCCGLPRAWCLAIRALNKLVWRSSMSLTLWRGDRNSVCIPWQDLLAC